MMPVMAFDTDQALLSAHVRDRNTARFFRDQSAEIRRFDLALSGLYRGEYGKAADSSSTAAPRVAAKRRW